MTTLAAHMHAHDFRLFALAWLASLVLGYTAFYLLPRRAPVSSGPAIVRVALAGASLGGAVWAAFGLTWRGYFPFVDTTLPALGLLTSLGLSITGGTVSVAVLAFGETSVRNTLLSGSILTATVSCLLFSILSGIAEPLALGYDLFGVLISMIGATLLAAFGLQKVQHISLARPPLLPTLLVTAVIPALNIGTFLSILPFTEWEAVSATPGALALQPLTIVFLSEIAVAMVLTRAGAAVDRQGAARTRQENERLRQLTDSTFEGLLVHRDGLVIDANSAFCTMVGLPLDAVRGKPIAAFAIAVPEQAGQQPSETDLRVDSGETIPVEMLSRDINLGDGQVRVTAVRDIRERRAAERSTQDRQRAEDLQHETEEARARQHIAEEASRAKSAFLAMMSHEIRTPLNAVLGLASVLLDDRLTSEQHEVVQAIYTSGHSLLRILNDILDFSRLDTGRMTFELSPFSPATLNQETLSMHGPGAAEKGLTLEVTQADDLPSQAVGDSGRIAQVLHNLVSNAVKFTKTGVIRVHCHCIERTDETALVEWTVSDTGIGIAPDKLGGLFNAFVQADSSIARRFGGSGLGLAISKQLVEQMGGTINAASTLGVGSKFTVRLPLRLLARPASQVGDAPTNESLVRRLEVLGRPLRILLAEDNATNQFVFMRLLKGTSVAVDVANNGHEAIVMTAARLYDMVCMDMSMPQMDGLEATRIIRRTPGPCQNVPIIAITANVFQEDMDACQAAGMTDFVSKPVNRRTLLEAILRAIDVQAVVASA